jgi:hypothetical protein
VYKLKEGEQHRKVSNLVSQRRLNVGSGSLLKSTHQLGILNDLCSKAFENRCAI